MYTQPVTVSPMSSVPPVQQPFDKLLAALNAGWRVQSPVYYRQQWFTAQGNKLGFYFIVKKGDETDLVIVPDGDKVRQLIELQHLKIIAA